MKQKEEITKALLRKLVYMGKWEGNHTNVKNHQSETGGMIVATTVARWFVRNALRF